jgi:hypothetical protein
MLVIHLRIFMQLTGEVDRVGSCTYSAASTHPQPRWVRVAKKKKNKNKKNNKKKKKTKKKKRGYVEERAFAHSQ